MQWVGREFPALKRNGAVDNVWRVHPTTRRTRIGRIYGRRAVTRGQIHVVSLMERRADVLLYHATRRESLEAIPCQDAVKGSRCINQAWSQLIWIVETSQKSNTLQTSILSGNLND